ncbi:MAG: hypothetical protein HC882_02875, partial [Acidobacteria bacterium]|nr:hypothetical protein [Acidobacteriota bacterium]
MSMSFAARFAFAALAVGLVAPHAVAGELLLNRGFETGTTEEWRKLGAGTIRADAAQRRDGAFSLALEPFLTTVGVRQSLSVGEVVGRRVTISGWMKTVAGTSGIRTSLALSTATGYSSTCDAVFPATLPWTYFTVSCDLGSDFYFAAVDSTPPRPPARSGSIRFLSSPRAIPHPSSSPRGAWRKVRFPRARRCSRCRHGTVKWGKTASSEPRSTRCAPTA